MIHFGILLAALLATAIIVYWLGLTGTLIFDDYTNFTPLGEDGGCFSKFRLWKCLWTEGTTGLLLCGLVSELFQLLGRANGAAK